MKIPVTVYERIGNVLAEALTNSQTDTPYHIEWIDINGVNTPYLVTIV